MPAAAAPAESHSVDSAQNGPLTTYVAVTDTHRIAIVGRRELVPIAATRLSASNPSGIAVCHIRSRRASELRPHRIISTEATPNGTEFSSPVCMSVSPNDLMICGCHKERHWLAPDAPA